MNSIQVIDLIFVTLVVLMIIHGYVRGFIKELFSWAALVVAVLGAVFFHPRLADLIRSSIMPEVRYVPEVLAFVGIFLAVLLICKIVEQILKNVITGAKLGSLDKILGAVFGFVEGIAITALVLFVLSVQPLFDVTRLINDSIFAQILLPHINRIPMDMGRDTVIALLSGISFPWA